MGPFLDPIKPYLTPQNAEAAGLISIASLLVRGLIQTQKTFLKVLTNHLSHDQDALGTIAEQMGASNEIQRALQNGLIDVAKSSTAGHVILLEMQTRLLDAALRTPENTEKTGA